MHIVILGAGKTGSYVATALAKEQHDVILIDKDAKILEKIGRENDVATLQATAPSWKLFEDLIANRPDLFFAATGDDETNLVSCTIAKKFGFAKTIARVHSRDYLNHAHLDFGSLFSVDHFLSPELLAAQDLLKILVHASDIAVEHFAHGAIQMRTLLIPDLWKKGLIPIQDLALPEDLIVGLIRRKISEGEKILFPHGNDHILPGDEVTIVGDAKIMRRLHEIFHFPKSRIRSVVLVGGSAVAVHLTHFLLSSGIHVRLIENDFLRCQELAERFPTATIIHRDGRDPHLHRSERIEDADALVSCTHYDEKNLLIASLAKQIGCPKTIAQITEPSFIPLLEKLGVLPALSAQVNVTNRLLSILHKENILSIASLSCDVAKIVELKVSVSSKLVGIPLAKLSAKLPKDLLIGAIESKGKVMVGRGNRILSPDDIVIAICHSYQIPQLQQLFH